MDWSVPSTVVCAEPYSASTGPQANDGSGMSRRSPGGGVGPEEFERITVPGISETTRDCGEQPDPGGERCYMAEHDRR